MKKKSAIRIASISDLLLEGIQPEVIITAFVSVNKAAWPPPFPQEILWTEYEVSQHIKNCPQLQFCAIYEGRIIGTVSTIHISESAVLNCKGWESISGFGTLKTHTNDGNCMFGIDLSVIPEFQGKGVSEKLITTALLMGAVLVNKKGCFLGSRMPSYHKKSHIPVEQYVFGKKLEGKTMDPEIRLYQGDGFRIINIIPDYIKDPDSLNYGALMFWENPFYKYTRYLPIHWIKPMLKKIIMR